MGNHPAIVKLMCVAVVVCIVLPLGRALFPYVGDLVDNLAFSALETALSVAGGWGIYFALFG